MSNSSTVICFDKSFLETSQEAADRLRWEQETRGRCVQLVRSLDEVPGNGFLVLPFQGNSLENVQLLAAARRQDVRVLVYFPGRKSPAWDIEPEEYSYVNEVPVQVSHALWLEWKPTGMAGFLEMRRREKKWPSKWAALRPEQLQMPEGGTFKSWVRIADIPALLKKSQRYAQSKVCLQHSQEILREQAHSPRGLEQVLRRHGPGWKKVQLTLRDVRFVERPVSPRESPDSVLVETGGWSYWDVPRKDLIWYVTDARFREQESGEWITLATAFPWREVHEAGKAPRLEKNPLHWNIRTFLEMTGYVWKEEKLGCFSRPGLSPGNTYPLHLDMSWEMERPWNEMHCGYEWAKKPGMRSHGMRWCHKRAWDFGSLVNTPWFPGKMRYLADHVALQPEMLWERWEPNQLLDRGTVGWHKWSSHGQPTWISMGRMPGNMKKQAGEDTDPPSLSMTLGLLETNRDRRGAFLANDWTPSASEEPPWNWSPPWLNGLTPERAEKRVWQMVEKLEQITGQIRNVQEIRRTDLDIKKYQHYIDEAETQLLLLKKEYWHCLQNVSGWRAMYEKLDGMGLDEKAVQLIEKLNAPVPKTPAGMRVVEALEEMLCPDEVSEQEILERQEIEAARKGRFKEPALIRRERRREKRKARYRSRLEAWQHRKEWRVERAMEQYQDEEWGEKQAEHEGEVSERFQENRVRRWLYA